MKRLTFFLFFVSSVYSQVSFTGNYSQDFDSLASTGTSNGWINNGTLAGWYAANSGNVSSTGFGSYSSSAGTGDNGLRVFRQNSASTDMALGVTIATAGSSNGNTPSWIGLRLANNTGSTIYALSISYAGEQWYQGLSTSAVSTTLSFGYSLTATNLSGSFTDVSALSFTSPTTTSTTATSVLNGNLSGNSIGFSGVEMSIPGGWTDGSDLWLRWQNTLTVSGSGARDNGLAIDNLSISSIPEVRPYGMWIISLILILKGSLKAKKIRV